MRSNESRQAILPDALRVNANLFQTDLCRNPDYMEVFELAIHGAGFGNCSCVALPPASMQSTCFPAGMAGMTIFVHNDMDFALTRPAHQSCHASQH